MRAIDAAEALRLVAASDIEAELARIKAAIPNPDLNG